MKQSGKARQSAAPRSRWVSTVIRPVIPSCSSSYGKAVWGSRAKGLCNQSGRRIRLRSTPACSDSASQAAVYRRDRPDGGDRGRGLQKADGGNGTQLRHHTGSFAFLFRALPGRQGTWRSRPRDYRSFRDWHWPRGGVSGGGALPRPLFLEGLRLDDDRVRTARVLMAGRSTIAGNLLSPVKSRR